MMQRHKIGYYAIIFLTIIALFFFKDSLKKSLLENDTGQLPQLTPYVVSTKELSGTYKKEKQAEIRTFVEANWKNDQETLAFLVAQDGQVLFEHYQGMADNKKGQSLTATTPLHVASVTKVFTATAIMQLVHAGKLALNQKVHTILKDFPYPEVTIKMLLNHRSGLQNYAYYFDQPGAWDKKKAVLNADILHCFITQQVPKAFNPNKRFSYCNTNYAFLAIIIEKITGLSYPEAMKKMIFEPLQMRHTFVYEHQKMKGKVIPSYLSNGIEYGTDHLDAVYGDKNIYSTPRDLLLFDNARYSPAFLSPELIKQIYSPYSFENPGEKNYGLGIRMLNYPNGQNFYYHNGWWHGNTSSYINMRKEKVLIVALSNRYSKKPYRAKLLAPLFGDYPFKDKNEIDP